MKVSEALEYLESTDDKLGQLKASAKYYDYKVKQVKAAQYLSHTQGAVADKEAKALISPEVKDAYREKRDVEAEMETIIAKRKTAELHIEVYRTQAANRRQGNI